MLSVWRSGAGDHDRTSSFFGDRGESTFGDSSIRAVLSLVVDLADVVDQPSAVGGLKGLDIMCKRRHHHLDVGERTCRVVGDSSHSLRDR